MDLLANETLYQLSYDPTIEELLFLHFKRSCVNLGLEPPGARVGVCPSRIVRQKLRMEVLSNSRDIPAFPKYSDGCQLKKRC